MNRLRYYILVTISMLFASDLLQAQEDGQAARRSPEVSRGSRMEEKRSGLPDLTVRAQDMNERMTQEIGNAPWMRIIYREVDLSKEQNAPLYYPVRPMNGNMNLFTLVFLLISEGKISAYEYLDGYEEFTESRVVNFKDVLDRAYIMYDEVPERPGGPVTFIINESDVPSEDVRSYYVKEAWYFDQNNSVFDVKTLAICPILYVNSDFGEQRMPMFWLPYENIRPYIANSYIMTSNFNNAKTFTIDDYFRRRMFEGDIVKTENLMNLTLMDYCPTPDSLANERENIENQLASFEKSLWMQPDTTQVIASTGKATKEKTTSSRATSTKEKAVKTSTPKAQKSAPVRSVRRR
ncbi:MAG: gliding motility protein GldN [Tannerellaceae bacterium]|nr:gliding motility protein GldN [Tannerellaceae bacterium]